MLLLKVLSFTLCLYGTYGSESSEELESLLSSPVGVKRLQTGLQHVYKKNKIDVFSTVIREYQDIDMNVTLIGAQNIYGPSGEIIEVRTLELHIPRNSVAKDNEDEDDDDDVNDLYKEVEELKKMFDLTSKLGFSINIAATEYVKTGAVLHSAFIDQISLKGYTEGIYFTNKTIEVNNSKEVNDYIKELRTKNVPVAVHKFDGNGQFLIEESNIVPEYLVSVLSEEGDADQKLLEDAQEGLATVCLKYQNNKDKVPSKLSEYLSLKYPQYDFNVFLNEPSSWYVNKDYKINLSYELVDWEGSEEVTYSIFVLIKEDKVTAINGTAAQ